MRVLLTGAAGFVGGHVAEALLSGGHDVRALWHYRRPANAKLEQLQGDLGQRADLERAVRSVDAVIHCAALLDPIEDAAEAERLNHVASVELARAAKQAGARSFVFLSSMAAIGYHPGAGLLAPDAPCRPTTVYGQSKLAAERSLLPLDSPGFRLSILRPPTVYGPGENRNFLALARAVGSGFFPIPGPGQNRMSLCWAKTLANVCARALELDGARGVLHVADDPPLRFREVVETLARAEHRRLFPLPFPLPLAKLAALGSELVFGRLGRPAPLSRARLRTITADTALDTARTRELGFELGVDFASAVRETVAWYRSEGLLA